MAAAEAARTAGFPNVYNVADGFEGPLDATAIAAPPPAGRLTACPGGSADHVHVLSRPGIKFIRGAYCPARGWRPVRGPRSQTDPPRSGPARVPGAKPGRQGPDAGDRRTPAHRGRRHPVLPGQTLPGGEAAARRRHRGRSARHLLDVVHRLHPASRSAARPRACNQGMGMGRTETGTNTWAVGGAYSIADIHLFRLSGNSAARSVPIPQSSPVCAPTTTVSCHGRRCSGPSRRRSRSDTI